MSQDYFFMFIVSRLHVELEFRKKIQDERKTGWKSENVFISRISSKSIDNKSKNHTVRHVRLRQKTTPSHQWKFPFHFWQFKIYNLIVLQWVLTDWRLSVDDIAYENIFTEKSKHQLSMYLKLKNQLILYMYITESYTIVC